MLKMASAVARSRSSVHFAAGVTCLLGLGCAPRSKATVLEVWAAGREGAVLEQLLPAFEASHPGLRVHVQQLPWISTHEKLLTAVVGESTPDVAQLGNTWIAEFATIGALAPLDAEIVGSTVLDPTDYFSGVWATNAFEGERFGVPWYVDTRLLFYRRDLLASAGYAQPPGTWKDWQAAMRAIRDQSEQARSQASSTGATTGATRVPLFSPLNEPEALLAFGLQSLEREQHSASSLGSASLLRSGGRFGNFRSPEFRHALDFYVSLFQSGLAPLETSANVANQWEEFARGSFVFFFSGPWQLGELAHRMPPALADSWGTAPLPGEHGPGASLALGSSLVVFAHSPKRREAWQLIEYLSEPAVQQHFYELTGDLPPRRSSWIGGGPALEPRSAAFHEQLERVLPMPAVPEWERIEGEVAVVEERAARGLVGVDAAAAELDARVDRILEKRRWMLDRGREPEPEALR